MNLKFNFRGCWGLLNLKILIQRPTNDGSSNLNCWENSDLDLFSAFWAINMLNDERKNFIDKLSTIFKIPWSLAFRMRILKDRKYVWAHVLTWAIH